MGQSVSAPEHPAQARRSDHTPVLTERNTRKLGLPAVPTARQVRVTKEAPSVVACLENGRGS